jgi:S1-C subfamily serine protease
MGQAFEYGEEDARRRFRGTVGNSAVGGDNFANVPDSVLVNVKESKNILDEAHTHHKAEADLRAGLKSDMGFEVENYPGGGVYVRKVAPLGAANHATIVQGDVITTFNDANVTDRDNLSELVSSMSPGEVATLSVRRGTDGRAEILILEAFVQGGDSSPMEVRESRKQLGMSVSTSTLYTHASAFREITSLPASLGLTAEGEPAVVKKIHGESSASRAGVNEGDILVSFGGEILQSAEQLESLLQGAKPGDWVKLAVERNGEREVVDVELAAPGETIEKVRSLRLMAGTLETLPSTWKGVNDSSRADSKSQMVKRELQDPANMAKALEEVEALPKEFGCQFNDTETGVAVVEVNNFLAIQASLVEGDVILEVNDQAVNSADELARLVDGMLAGDVVKVKLQRVLDGAADLVALEIMSATIGPNEVRDLRMRAGLPVNDQDIETPESALKKLKTLSKRFGFRVTDKNGDGVEIVKVNKNGVVEHIGAALGDVIHHVNDAHVTDVQSFVSVAQDLLVGDTVNLRVTRTDPVSGESQELVLTTELSSGEAHARAEWIRALRKIANLSVFCR